MATAVSVDSVEKEHPWMIQTGKGTKVAPMAFLYMTGSCGGGGERGQDPNE